MTGDNYGKNIEIEQEIDSEEELDNWLEKKLSSVMSSDCSYFETSDFDSDNEGVSNKAISNLETAAADLQADEKIKKNDNNSDKHEQNHRKSVIVWSG